jgi:predicted esterase YcpF (UPF0227 family)
MTMGMGSNDTTRDPNSGMMRGMALTHLIYLHGFRSSSRSTKAQRMAQWVNGLGSRGVNLHWSCPDLPPAPAAAFSLIESLTHDWPGQTMAVLGSSLGGFYAARLAALKGCKAVLLNPAVDPARDLKRHLGPQTLWHDPSQSFEFTQDHVAQLQGLQVGPGTALPDTPDMLAVIATGDEVLNWQEMMARYGHSQVHLIEGSDHALSDFDAQLPVIEAYLMGQ